MNTQQQRRSMAVLASTVVLSFAMAGCGSMTTRERNTAVGAGVGGVAGNVLSGGSTAGTLGGAAVGGVIGNQIDKK